MYFDYGVPHYLNIPRQPVSKLAGLVLRDFLMEDAASQFDTQRK